MGPDDLSEDFLVAPWRTRRPAPIVRGTDSKVILQVGSVAAAQRADAAGVDVIIVQGTRETNKLELNAVPFR